MTPGLHIKLSGQISRQAPEADALEPQIAAMQPAIDSAQAWADSCAASVTSAQTALDTLAALEGSDTTEQQAAVTAATQTLEAAKADLSALTEPRDALAAKLAALRSSIAHCQGLIASGGLVITPQQVETAKLDEAKADGIRRIDVDTDLLYGTVVGNRATEYSLAEAEAATFRAAGYSGVAPASVGAWAVAKHWTAQQAADDILQTAAHWRQAQAAIRAQRLAAKEAVRGAADQAGVAAALAGWRTFLAQIRALLGL